MWKCLLFIELLFFAYLWDANLIFFPGHNRFNRASTITQQTSHLLHQCPPSRTVWPDRVWSACGSFVIIIHELIPCQLVSTFPDITNIPSTQPAIHLFPPPSRTAVSAAPLQRGAKCGTVPSVRSLCEIIQLGVSASPWLQAGVQRLPGSGKRAGGGYHRLFKVSSFYLLT